MATTEFQIQNPAFVQTIRRVFNQQGLMHSLEAVLIAVEAGAVTIELPVTTKITQQHGFVHAGVLTSIVDTACGCAALTLMPPESHVLTVEYKVNFLSPAQGVKAVAKGHVVKPGRTITVCQGDVYMVDEAEQQKLCAIMLATMIRRPIRS